MHHCDISTNAYICTISDIFHTTDYAMQKSNNTRKEWLVYAVVWIGFFLFPLLSVLLHSAFGNHTPVRWEGMARVWASLGILLLFFLLHNFLITPILINKHNILKYSGLTLLLGLFFIGGNLVINEKWPMKPMIHLDGHGKDLEKPIHPDARPTHDEPPHNHDAHWRHKGKKNKLPPLDLFIIIWGGFFLVAIGSNVATKFYFKNQDNKNRLRELEKENLAQQLESLRYQVNPHFLMNTLNNIHALVDINPEYAKSSILELSKMMRYVLHEGANVRIPLQRELHFINHYIALMRLRYDENVTITTDFEHANADTVIAPLLLIPFVENAFKHGVSYQQPSYIDVKLFTDDEHVTMLCANSKAKNSPTMEERSGVGLENVNRRLELIYGEKYSLNINESDTDFKIALTLPLEKETNKT